MAKTQTRDGWLEERLELKKHVDWFLYRKVPRGVGWMYTLGSATGVTFLLLLFTGAFLIMNYVPSPDHAWDSIQYIMNEVPFGGFIRSVHFWSASAIVVMVGLHGMRVFFMAAYKYPRELTWVTGTLIFILVMGAAFTGYLLPWDQRAYWATNVGTGIAGSLPLVGSYVQKILMGGTSIGAITLTRFFTFHVAIVAPLLILIVALHVFLVIRLGISGPIVPPSPKKKIGV